MDGVILAESPFEQGQTDCYPTEISTLLYKKMVLEWVCECVQPNPTQPKNLASLEYWSYKHFSASCILHVGTLLNFSKLIPSLIYMQVCLEQEDSSLTLSFLFIWAFESILFYCHIVRTYCIYGYCYLSFVMYHYLLDSNTHPTICQVGVVSGRYM